MFIVAVVGGIGTGKSTVAKVFERHGIPVVDANTIARQIWGQKIRELHGEEALPSYIEVNPFALDWELREKLNDTTYWMIYRAILWRIFKNFICGYTWIVLDLPIAFETCFFLRIAHKIVAVVCNPRTQLDRLLEQNEMSQLEARSHAAKEEPLNQKCKESDFVIDNDGSIEDTEDVAEQIYDMMQECKQHWYNRFSILGLTSIVIYFLSTISVSWLMP